MRLLAFVAISVILVISALRAEQAPMSLHDEPQPIPPIGFKHGDGRDYNLDDWRGRIVLLNIWATWCPPCRHEMPTLDRLQDQLGGERFEVIALSIDRAGVGVVRSFFEETGVRRLRLFLDETGESVRKIGGFGLPTTLLIGPQGNELARLVGPAEWDTPEMIAFLETVIAEHTGKQTRP
ncbi:TlpA family protein disulfide reductase [Minwuia thermotolerans]|uniref:TlpA family protein disulfide reductase n=1 Tax=Minwuia thermotolerans TaxID=2056226 RepID=A0A2M9G0G7_9PROT|nr:TlpA disulfide reductase family protein [Minwuia thermotolerans]PJK29211.1 TlpA family protein disulfide reductase [Minwuia thermotolerans]